MDNRVDSTPRLERNCKSPQSTMRKDRVICISPRKMLTYCFSKGKTPYQRIQLEICSLMSLLRRPKTQGGLVAKVSPRSIPFGRSQVVVAVFMVTSQMFPRRTLSLRAAWHLVEFTVLSYNTVSVSPRQTREGRG